MKSSSERRGYGPFRDLFIGILYSFRTPHVNSAETQAEAATEGNLLLQSEPSAFGF